ncbi:MYO1D [Cordylochernes scorpioides]|uniref:MYO1D n=1 Tax=Cordylochernes scorpioides TaxID=51811 RepID=A0ABY6JZ55_9ARAC|nr:MYO1D [Cordylochernes scorpioides]
MQRQDGSGRPRATTEREDRAIVRMAVAAPESTLSTIQRVTGTQVSKMTINRRLRERNLRARRLLRCLPLTPVHRQVRLQWCRERSTWNCADWGRIVFSDESRFLLCPDDRRKRVWRRPGQRVDPGLTVEHHTGPQQGVMVWGAISFDSRTPLVDIPGTLTAQRERELGQSSTTHTGSGRPSATASIYLTTHARTSRLWSLIVEPHYIRCIKPNEVKSPILFDAERVRHQICYLGLVENVQVRRAGFAYRETYSRFLRRYKMTSKYTWPNFVGAERVGCQVVVESHQLERDVEYGHTKIFVRSPRTIGQLEAARAALIPGIVVFLQKLWRGTMARVRYRKLLALLTIMKYYRKYKLRHYISSLQHTFSPDLAPSDYFHFGLLKKELKGKRFDSDEDVQKVVQDFFHTLPKSAYKEGIYKLPERWRRCIESQGDYFE